MECRIGRKYRIRRVSISSKWNGYKKLTCKIRIWSIYKRIWKIKLKKLIKIESNLSKTNKKYLWRT